MQSGCVAFRGSVVCASEQVRHDEPGSEEDAFEECDPLVDRPEEEAVCRSRAGAAGTQEATTSPRRHTSVHQSRRYRNGADHRASSALLSTLCPHLVALSAPSIKALSTSNRETISFSSLFSSVLIIDVFLGWGSCRIELAIFLRRCRRGFFASEGSIC